MRIFPQANTQLGPDCRISSKVTDARQVNLVACPVLSVGRLAAVSLCINAPEFLSRV